MPEGDDTELQASFNNLRRSALKLLELSPEIPDQARAALISVEQPEQLTDLLAGNLGIDLATKQRILEEADLLRRMRLTQEALQRQLEIAELQQKLRKDVEGKFSDTQRRAYLREQLKAIQRELGEEEADGEEQADQLRKKLQDAGASETVLAAAEKELKRLSHIPTASPEYSVIVSYVEMLADLPWNKSTDDNTDLARAQAILDRDHYGLEKVKRRIVEFLAVRKLNPGGRSPILCFIGPPGVGKTSLGQSIADALGRKFTRISLGGIRDEAEIRGHRRTYIGAMPGRIIQEIRRLGIRNPVMMLDEIDKMGADIRGDPASALLEVLDPRQNNSFRGPLSGRSVRSQPRDFYRYGQLLGRCPTTPPRPPGDDRCARLYRNGKAEHRSTIPCAEADRGARVAPLNSADSTRMQSRRSFKSIRMRPVFAIWNGKSLPFAGASLPRSPGAFELRSRFRPAWCVESSGILRGVCANSVCREASSAW